MDGSQKYLHEVLRHLSALHHVAGEDFQNQCFLSFFPTERSFLPSLIKITSVDLERFFYDC